MIRTITMRPIVSPRRASALFALTTLLFTHFVAAANADIAYLALDGDGYWQAWHMAANGSGQTQATHSPYDKSRISWYPDGSALLVNGNQGELVRVDLGSGEEQAIAIELSGMNDAVLSPDGRHIAFSLSTSDSIDDNNIWLTKADGSEPRKLTNKRFLQHAPAWSADSKAIYFLSGRGDQTHDIWRFDLVSGGLEQLTVGRLYHFDIAPGPIAGAKGALAFSANQSGNYEIWLWEQDEPPRQLTDHPGLDAGPSWSPDGTALLFASSRGGPINIWRLDVNAKQPLQITHHSGGARMPVWFSGGQP